MRSKGFWGGIITGTVIGAAIGMLADPINDRQHKKINNSTAQMFRTIGAVVDGIMNNM